MSKIKWFADEYRNIVTILSILLIVIVNIAFAAYAFGQVKSVMDDSRIFQSEQRKINQEFMSGLEKLNSRFDGYEIEHGELMRLHNLPPAKWQKVNPFMKPFPQ